MASRDRVRGDRRDVRARDRSRPGSRPRRSSEQAPASVTETGEQELSDLDARVVTRRRVTPNLAVRWEGLNPRRALVLGLVVSVVALTLAMPLRTYFSQQSEFDQLKTSNAQLRTEVADYQQKVNEQNDPAYIEAQARDRLKFVKPGEKPVVMMFPGDDARKAAEQQAEERRRAPWYGNLWDAVATPPTQK
ncbi:FtsB family cell division protein [Gordonia soli]|uniref:Septum formation initiator family protein n=1 Tax=Gordonia soli NBRC 108243 TaxID=1223545 RepID=M0QJ19_9ACTN|nr:septum formation initiator family protein [Gordonia soli]GAC68558.1 hypothetical protein GS4_16_00880 [Gordonia soli NBRC 108243]